MSVVCASARLVIRRLALDDIGDMHAVYGDARLMRWVGDGKPIGRLDCAEWIGVTHRNYFTRGYGMFALVDRAGGEVAGFAGLVHPGGQALPEVKYALKREFAGRGLATEAVSALLAHGHGRLSLAVITASVNPANAASRRVLAKAGFQELPNRPNPDGSYSCMYTHPRAAEPPG